MPALGNTQWVLVNYVGPVRANIVQVQAAVYTAPMLILTLGQWSDSYHDAHDSQGESSGVSFGMQSANNTYLAGFGGEGVLFHINCVMSR